MFLAGGIKMTYIFKQSVKTFVTDLNQWLQVDYEDEKTFYGVVLQGRPKHNQWTNSYQVQYKLVEADDFKFVSDASGTVEVGNSKLCQIRTTYAFETIKLRTYLQLNYFVISSLIKN